MIIIPALCAQSYAYNSRVEQAVAAYLANITYLTAIDFSVGARPEYDFQLGDSKGYVQIELKTSRSKYVPVETHVDEKQKIEGGLLKSTAQIVVALTMGKRTHYEGEVGKLRVWKRTSLIRDAVKHGIGKYYPASETSPGSYTYSFQPNKENYHIWLGDVPVFYHTVSSWGTTLPGYDLSAIFDDNKTGAAQLREMIDTMRGVDSE